MQPQPPAHRPTPTANEFVQTIDKIYSAFIHDFVRTCLLETMFPCADRYNEHETMNFFSNSCHPSKRRVRENFQGKFVEFSLAFRYSLSVEVGYSLGSVDFLRSFWFNVVSVWFYFVLLGKVFLTTSGTFSVGAKRSFVHEVILFSRLVAEAHEKGVFPLLLMAETCRQGRDVKYPGVYEKLLPSFFRRRSN